MSIYLMQDSSILQVVKKEIKLVDEEIMDTWIVEERRSMEINAKAMNTLICVLCPKEFNRISTCKIGKEIWDKLGNT